MFRSIASLNIGFIFSFALVLLVIVACVDESESNLVQDVVNPDDEQLLESTGTKVSPTATMVIVTNETPDPTEMPTAAPVATAVQTEQVAFDESRFVGVEGIVDPTNFGWPRSIETTEGSITLDAPPTRIHSLSLGHSEILAALVDFDRITAVYNFFIDQEQSNIAELSADAPMIGFDPEEVVALQPEVVVASRFTNPDNVALIKDAGIPVARTSLENSALGNVPNILLLGYLVGAEAEAIALADEIITRMQFVSEGLTLDNSLNVLSVSKWTSIFAAGSNSTEGGIIQQAGGINAAADAGIEGHQQVSLESIAAMNPDVIIVPQPREGADLFIEELMTSPALTEVKAIKDGEIHYVSPRFHTTLSHWNVRGVEELARLLFPSEFKNVNFEDFSQWGD